MNSKPARVPIIKIKLDRREGSLTAGPGAYIGDFPEGSHEYYVIPVRLDEDFGPGGGFYTQRIDAR